MFLEAVRPAPGPVAHLAILGGDGKRRCTVRYAVATQGQALGGTLAPDGKASGATFEVEITNSLMFTGFGGN